MKLVKQIGYKLIVAICIVMTFCCFIASTPVEASKVNTSDFYYSGTIKGSYTVEKGFFARLIGALDQILDYILGIATMGFRIVFVGWTALMERCLTWILEGATGEDVEIEKVSTTNITGSDNYITLDAIFFNRVPLLDINVFNFEVRDDVTATGFEIEEGVQGENEPANAPMIVYTEEHSKADTSTNIVRGEKKDFYGNAGDPGAEGDEEDDDSLVIILKKAIAGWYYTFRVISIMVMLILLVYIGIKLAIQSSATEKALYKRVLMDWLVGMIIVFSIHYIMLFIIQFNEILIEQISKMRLGATGLEVYEYGLIERAQEPVENEELEMTLYEEVKTRAYDAKLSVGTVGMIMYMVLVYYAWKYTFIYLKRYLTVAVLVMAAPLVAVSYAFNKVNSGKSRVFSNWLKEFFFIVILQSIHALMYIVFVDTALAISLNSIAGVLLVFMLLNFMCKAEGIFRKIFNIQGNLTQDIAEGGGIVDAINSLKGGMVAMGAGKFAAKFTKGAARVATKPLRAAGGYGFGKTMQALSNNQKFKDWNKKKEDKSKIDEKERMEKIRAGSIAKAIQSGEIDVEKLRKTVSSLKSKKGQVIRDQTGKSIVVDDEYIASEEKAFLEIAAIDSKKDEHAAAFDKMTTKRALAGRYISGKWKDIMNPHNYVEKDEKTGKYKAVKTTREYGKFGRKTDSIGMRLSKRVNAEKLFGLDKNTKAALKQQADIVKQQVVGFAGLLVGLPLLVAEPALGSALLYQGVTNSHAVYGSSKGRRKKRDLSKVRFLDNGKYTLTRFDGASAQTIAEESKRMSREQAEQIFLGKAMHDAGVVNNVKKKHPKLYNRLKGTVKVAGATGTTIALATVAPITLPVAAVSVTAGAVSAAFMSTGIGNGGSNAYYALHETLRAARRANAKAYEKAEKESKEELATFTDETVNGFLESMANLYQTMEEEQHTEATNRHTLEFMALYTALKTKEEEKIDEIPEEDIRLKFEYEDVEFEKDKEGTIKLSGSSENTIIENAIMDAAQKAGIMDLEKFDLSDSHMQQINKEITDKLLQLGLLNEGQSSSSVIVDLENKIQKRQAKLLKTAKPEDIENRMADRAIIETMRDKKGSNDPAQLDPEAVMEKMREMYASAGDDSMQPTQESSNAVTQLINERPQDGSVPVNPLADGSKAKAVLDEAKVATIISARQTILSDRSKKKISTETTQHLKEALKKKKSVELASVVLEQQEDLEKNTGPTLLDTLTNEAGGLDSTQDGSQEVSKTDDVLKMLQLQTKMHKDKMELQRITEEKKKAVRAQIFEPDGGIGINPTRDGSRRLGGTTSTTGTASTDYTKTKIDDLLKTLNK